jgi:hypothetical protein
MVDLARWLRHNVAGRPYSLRKVAAELAEYGYRGPGGVHCAAAAVASMLAEVSRPFDLSAARKNR